MLVPLIPLSQTPMTRHKTFISYHHENDQEHKDWLVDNFDDWAFIDHSVGYYSINPKLKPEKIRCKLRDEHLQIPTVTLVLIGTDTWKRKYVDWEIASSLRDTKNNPRSGLVGLILPTRDDYWDEEEFDMCTIPPRVYDNYMCGYAQIHHFPMFDIYKTMNEVEEFNCFQELNDILHTAFTNKYKYLPKNSRPKFLKNRYASSWC
jgi:hypothetical protein